MPKCPICETLVEDGSYTETYTSPINKQEYKKYECPNCELHWWEPLKIIPEFYESEVFGVGFHIEQRNQIAPWHKPFFIHFPKNVKGRLLDIGCGDGVFLREAQKHGFEVWGIDFDSKSIETAKKSLGVDTLYPMSLEEFYEHAKKNNLTFDVITFFEVLEHQDNPKRFLEMTKYLLKPGGYIAGSVPNRESYFVKKQYEKKILSLLDLPPHHFLRFSDTSLKNALKLAGFGEVEGYFTPMSLNELTAFIQRVYFRKVETLKNWIKSKLVVNEELSQVVSVEDIYKMRKDKLTKILILFKKLRFIILLPFSLFFIKIIKFNGYQLYFQAKRI